MAFGSCRYFHKEKSKLLSIDLQCKTSNYWSQSSCQEFAITLSEEDLGQNYFIFYQLFDVEVLKAYWTSLVFSTILNWLSSTTIETLVDEFEKLWKAFFLWLFCLQYFSLPSLDFPDLWTAGADFKSPTVLGQRKLIFMKYQHTCYDLQFLLVWHLHFPFVNDSKCRLNALGPLRCLSPKQMG